MNIAPVQTWNSNAYAANGRFVATLASDVVALLDPQPGERILDAGCGDGALTARLVASGAILRGVDASAAMVQAARARGLEIDEASITALPYDSDFDAVFSNAALHWISADQQPAALMGIHRALRSGGRFVAEMGGQGNIAAIRTALSAVLSQHRIDPEILAASFYPSAEHFRELLEDAGFEVETIGIHPRPTPLPGDPEGMSLWLNTFRNGVLDGLLPAARAEALAETVALLRPVLYDSRQQQDGIWTADYVRLRFKAIKR